MTGWTTTLAVGSRLRYQGEALTVIAIEGSHLTLRSQDGRTRAANVRHVLAESLVLSSSLADEPQDALGPLVANLSDGEGRRLAERVGHVREILTGYRSGSAELARDGEPHPAYRPGRPILDRQQAKAVELGVGVRTVQRWLAAFATDGPAGLVDGRHHRESDPLRGLDQRWIDTCRAVLGEHADEGGERTGVARDGDGLGDRSPAVTGSGADVLETGIWHVTPPLGARTADSMWPMRRSSPVRPGRSSTEMRTTSTAADADVPSGATGGGGWGDALVPIGRVPTRRVRMPGIDRSIPLGPRMSCRFSVIIGLLSSFRRRTGVAGPAPTGAYSTLAPPGWPVAVVRGARYAGGKPVQSPNGATGCASISGDGTTIAFRTGATRLGHVEPIRGGWPPSLAPVDRVRSPRPPHHGPSPSKGVRWTRRVPTRV